MNSISACTPWLHATGADCIPRKLTPSSDFAALLRTQLPAQPSMPQAAIVEQMITRAAPIEGSGRCASGYIYGVPFECASTASVTVLSPAAITLTWVAIDIERAPLQTSRNETARRRVRQRQRVEGFTPEEG
ncbi:hypothetical protein ACW9IB_05840 [Pseudomonas sp. SDO524_S393]